MDAGNTASPMFICQAFCKTLALIFAVLLNGFSMFRKKVNHGGLINQPRTSRDIDNPCGVRFTKELALYFPTGIFWQERAKLCVSLFQ